MKKYYGAILKSGLVEVTSEKRWFNDKLVSSKVVEVQSSSIREARTIVWELLGIRKKAK